MEESSVTLYKKSVQPYNTDYIARIEADEANPSQCCLSYIAETGEFTEKLLYPFFENIVLKDIVKNLWKNCLYNQEYISYLLNTCTKKEFLNTSGKFAEPFKKISEDQLYLTTKLILNILNQPLTSGEISLLLNIDPNDLDSASLPLIEYNPEQVEF